MTLRVYFKWGRMCHLLALKKILIRWLQSLSPLLLHTPLPYITSHVFKTMKMIPTNNEIKNSEVNQMIYSVRESAEHRRNFSKPQFHEDLVSFTFVMSGRKYLRGLNHFAGDIRSSVTSSDPDSLTLLTYFPFPAFVSLG